MQDERVNCWVKLFKEGVMADAVEIETYLHPIPLKMQIDEDEKGKEVIMRIRDLNIDNDNTFYTDSNGLELQKRVLNYRESWELKVNEEVSGNYYPVNAMIGIRDKEN